MSKIYDALEKLKLEKANEQPSEVKPEENNNNIDEIIPDDALIMKAAISDMSQPDLLTDRERAEMRIIGPQMSDRRVFNAFRDLRTTVIQNVKTSSPIIMVTSSTYGSGSSFVATNLAAAIAMDGTKTSLLVDCNLDNPQSCKLSKSENPLGLIDYLEDSERSIEEIISPTGIPRMRLITAGEKDANKSEFFTSKRLHFLFEKIKERYDQRFIIVDAPPINENADARILSEVCDYVILVVPYGKVNNEAVLNTARVIGKEKLLGAVFNNEPRTPAMSWQ
ncbi:MAG: AAA family ATPase [Gammaproteobacteria bacterium]|nr:AAA family ATPase [Gammaproteobacteria bacterium]